MGIAGGTANVGPIVNVEPGSLKDFDPSRLNYVDTGAIKVTVGYKHIGYGFNDVVIRNTFLGTIDGKMVNISVESMVKKGEKVAVTPASDITTDRFSISKNGNPVKNSISRPAQIIVSPLDNDNFYGRAIAGILCMSAYSPLKAAIALFDQVIVKPENDSKGIDSFSQSEHRLSLYNGVKRKIS